ncbi:MAG: DNA/RNA nuclease SfsA [Armatimonadota bacterium]
MLIIPGPARWARFIEKPNRFVAAVEMDGGVVRAHVPTSSRMRELLVPGAEVLLVGRPRPGGATQHDLVMVRAACGLVSVDSRVPNRLLGVVLREGGLAEFMGWELVRPEVTLGDSRLDFLLSDGERRCWIEAKSVTLVVDGAALFPDAPTARGARHLGELAKAREAGDRAAAVFIVQRGDADRFTPNRALDPAFALALEDAARRGVEIYAYCCRVEPGSISIERRIPVEMNG